MGPCWFLVRGTLVSGKEELVRGWETAFFGWDFGIDLGLWWAGDGLLGFFLLGGHFGDLVLGRERVAGGRGTFGGWGRACG